MLLRHMREILTRPELTTPFSLTHEDWKFSPDNIEIDEATKPANIGANNGINTI